VVDTEPVDPGEQSPVKQVSLKSEMAEQDAVATEQESMEGSEADRWRERALEAERRLAEHRALEEEQLEVRRRGTDLLEQSLIGVEQDRDEWKRRAEASNARISQMLSEIEQKCIELDTELDGWRRRALAAEALVAEQAAELEAHRERLDLPSPEQATETVSNADRREQRPARRPRGNWLPT
jgi:hypothetical protein